jgi:hypothetical protein
MPKQRNQIMIQSDHDFRIVARRAESRAPDFVQPSTLYFLNQACIWFQPSSAASLR